MHIWLKGYMSNFHHRFKFIKVCQCERGQKQRSESGFYIHLFKGSHNFPFVDDGLFDSRSRSLYLFSRLR